MIDKERTTFLLRCIDIRGYWSWFIWYCIPDGCMDRIITLLSSSIRRRKKKKAGRPRMNDRTAMSAIFYIQLAACQWNALSRSLGASVTGTWQIPGMEKGWCFQAIVDWWIVGIWMKTGIDWKWQAMDALLQKRLLGEKSTGPNPTDRGEIRYKT